MKFSVHEIYRYIKNPLTLTSQGYLKQIVLHIIRGAYGKNIPTPYNCLAYNQLMLLFNM